QREERGGEKPGQVPHAAGDDHLVAQRAQHIIAAEQHEKIAERPQRRRQLLRSCRHRPADPALQGGPAIACGWRARGVVHGNDSFCFSSAALTCWPYPGWPRWKRRASASLPTTTGSKPASRTRPAAICTASGSSPAIGMACLGSGRWASFANTPKPIVL